MTGLSVEQIVELAKDLLEEGLELDIEGLGTGGMRCRIKKGPENLKIAEDVSCGDIINAFRKAGLECTTSHYSIDHGHGCYDGVALKKPGKKDVEKIDLSQFPDPTKIPRKPPVDAQTAAEQLFSAGVGRQKP